MADTPPRRGSAPQFTIAEAVQWLDPPITAERLAALLRVAGVQATGVRRKGHIGRPEKTYDAAEIMRLHSAILEWLLFIPTPDANRYNANHGRHHHLR